MKKLVVLLFSLISCASYAAQPDGATLYRHHCAACHGANGTGGVGVPLALPDFQYTVTRDYLYKTIRMGRPGRVMPAFKHLSEDEVNALIKHIRSWAPGKPFTYPAQPVKGDVQRGAQLFQQHCAACHGADGKGGKGTGVTFSRPRDLPVIAPALNNPGFLAAAGDQMIKATLMNGREGTPMISFLKQGLVEQDIDNIVAYIRSFAAQPVKKPSEAEAESIMSYESPYSLEETVNAIKRAAIGKNFRIIRVQPLEQGLVAKGQENQKQIIVYFCNFELLNKALAVDPRVGMFLPCRVTALEENGKVTVMTTNPKRMSRFFNNDELDKLCDEMYRTYAEILEESTL